MGNLALENVKVLEMCSMVAGPFCGKLLADMGADVIKVEPPGEGDEARRRGPFYKDEPHPEGSLLFTYVNTNKRGITLDFSNAHGKDILLELADHVDILLVDKPYLELKKLGLDNETLRQRNPQLIVTSVSPFGGTGPYRDYKAYYLNTYHAGGEGYILPGGRLADTLYPEGEPIMAGGYLGEYQAGLDAAVATMGALMGRLMDGEGAHIDVSKQEALVNLNCADFCLHPDQGVFWHRRDRGWHQYHYVGGLFQCKDGFWEFLVQGDRQWQGLVEVLGHPAWAEDERFSTQDKRMAHLMEIDERVEEWAMGHTREEIYHLLQGHGVAAGPVYTPEELWHDKQLASRGFFVDIEHPHIGRLEIPSVGHKFSRTPWEIRRPSPSLGEHNREVYCDWLGHQVGEISDLHQGKII